MNREYIIFSDESDKKGRFYSNFYGGLMVGSSDYKDITEALGGKKSELCFFGEVKWKKVTERYLEKYIELIQFFGEAELLPRNVCIRLFSKKSRRYAETLISESPPEWMAIWAIVGIILIAIGALRHMVQFTVRN